MSTSGEATLFSLKTKQNTRHRISVWRFGGWINAVITIHPQSVINKTPLLDLEGSRRRPLLNLDVYQPESRTGMDQLQSCYVTTKFFIPGEKLTYLTSDKSFLLFPSNQACQHFDTLFLFRYSSPQLVPAQVSFLKSTPAVYSHVCSSSFEDDVRLTESGRNGIETKRWNVSLQIRNMVVRAALPPTMPSLCLMVVVRVGLFSLAKTSVSDTEGFGWECGNYSAANPN